MHVRQAELGWKILLSCNTASHTYIHANMTLSRCVLDFGELVRS